MSTLSLLPHNLPWQRLEKKLRRDRIFLKEMDPEDGDTITVPN